MGLDRARIIPGRLVLLREEQDRPDYLMTGFLVGMRKWSDGKVSLAQDRPDFFLIPSRTACRLRR